MKTDRIYLDHILECIFKIDKYIAGGKSEFIQNPMAQDAVLRNLHTMAESSQRLSRDLKERNPEVRWQSLSGFRNVLVHDYLGIDIHEVWRILEHDLPELKVQIERILLDQR